MTHHQVLTRDAAERRVVRWCLAGVALSLSVAAEVAVLRIGAPTIDTVHRMLFRYSLAAGAFVLGALAVRRLPVPSSLALALAGGALLQAVAIGYPPTTTDDFWRYLWDGKVQAAGVDPYRYAPLDPALAHLRDAELFPPDGRTPEQAAGVVANHGTDHCTSAGVPHDCTEINRPNVRTIYPPVAEAGFLWLHAVSPSAHRVKTLQGALGALAVATTAALAWALRRAGRDPRAAVWWAWCPAVWLECANNAHIDVLGVLLLVCAWGTLAGRAATTRRLVGAGALFGASVAVKLMPALIAPALLVKKGHVLLGTAVGVFLIGYVPHVAAVGTKVLGYLPGYLNEEGYDGAQRFGTLRLVLPGHVAPAAAALIGAALAVAVGRRAADHPSAGDAVLLAGVAFVLVGPSQPWYGLLLVALAVLAERPAWLAVAAAAYPVYQAGNLQLDNTAVQQWSYLGALGIVVLAYGAAARMKAWPAPTPSS